jgi:hypothetical protein
MVNQKMSAITKESAGRGFREKSSTINKDHGFFLLR